MKTYALVILGILAVWWIRVAINTYDRPNAPGVHLAWFIVAVISLVILFPVAVFGGFL
jgi:heme O synthase-like polyprenyltransferase